MLEVMEDETDEVDLLCHSRERQPWRLSLSLKPESWNLKITKPNLTVTFFFFELHNGRV